MVSRVVLVCGATEGIDGCTSTSAHQTIFFHLTTPHHLHLLCITTHHSATHSPHATATLHCMHRWIHSFVEFKSSQCHNIPFALTHGMVYACDERRSTVSKRRLTLCHALLPFKRQSIQFHSNQPLNPLSFQPNSCSSSFLPLNSTLRSAAVQQCSAVLTACAFSVHSSECASHHSSAPCTRACLISQCNAMQCSAVQW